MHLIRVLVCALYVVSTHLYMHLDTYSEKRSGTVVSRRQARFAISSIPESTRKAG